MKIAGEALGKAKKIIFADPKLLFEEERHLINQPFFWQGTNDKGILLVHGWTSTPYEVRRLGRYLKMDTLFQVFSLLGMELCLKIWRM